MRYLSSQEQANATSRLCGHAPPPPLPSPQTSALGDPSLPSPNRHRPLHPSISHRPTCSNTANSASLSCCCRVKRARRYLEVRPGPQGPMQRMTVLGVAPQIHSRVDSLRLVGGGQGC
jgi:hypothetical protein